ncbi:MAG: bifunctional molybdenum cofactor biosynthesis protein MoaC/MoaB [Bacteroidetes bacterium]|nr:MAG: bifunctional molybdenum cofactor biosynthesis protein MoaC/MoaB [Bacteroidota bacterium]
MRDITSKITTLRTAKAIGTVFCSENTILLIQKNEIPKGNIFEFARAAGFFAAKKTDQLLPHCHPVGIDSMEMSFEISHQPPAILISAETKFIGRTGIEMESLTAVSIAALTIYDMLKPVDNQLSIGDIKLIDKKGGKSERKYFNTPPSCAVLVCSDSTFEGKREDNSGKKIIEMLEKQGITTVEYKILPDEKIAIQTQIKTWVEKDIHYIFTTGGTGLGPRDNTVSAVSEILERDADGITEAMRAHGQMRTPLAMMSRAVAGSIAYTTIITLPGSSDGVRECLEAILPAVFHARKMLKGGGH